MRFVPLFLVFLWVSPCFASTAEEACLAPFKRFDVQLRTPFGLPFNDEKILWYAPGRFDIALSAREESNGKVGILRWNRGSPEPTVLRTVDAKLPYLLMDFAMVGEQPQILVLRNNGSVGLLTPGQQDVDLIFDRRRFNVSHDVKWGRYKGRFVPMAELTQKRQPTRRAHVAWLNGPENPPVGFPDIPATGTPGSYYSYHEAPIFSPVGPYIIDSYSPSVGGHQMRVYLAEADPEAGGSPKGEPLLILAGSAPGRNLTEGREFQWNSEYPLLATQEGVFEFNGGEVTKISEANLLNGQFVDTGLEPNHGIWSSAGRLGLAATHEGVSVLKVNKGSRESGIKLSKMALKLPAEWKEKGLQVRGWSWSPGEELVFVRSYRPASTDDYRPQSGPAFVFKTTTGALVGKIDEVSQTDWDADLKTAWNASGNRLVLMTPKLGILTWNAETFEVSQLSNKTEIPVPADWGINRDHVSLGDIKVLTGSFLPNIVMGFDGSDPEGKMVFIVEKRSREYPAGPKYYPRFIQVKIP